MTSTISGAALATHGGIEEKVFTGLAPHATLGASPPLTATSHGAHA